MKPFIHGAKKVRGHGEIISKVKSIRWGEKHGVILDMKGRVFAMGDTSKGRLGLTDEKLPEQVMQPR